MAFTMGQAPEQMRVVLVANADFYATFRRGDGTPWQVEGGPEVQLILDFGATEWSATFNGDAATWNVPEDQVDALIASRPRQVRLWYVEGDMRLLWAQGDIDVRTGERV